MMGTNDRLQRWRQELQQLQRERARLAQAWEAPLDELRSMGRPPSLELLADQEAYNLQLASLAADMALDYPQITEHGWPALDALSGVCEELLMKQQAQAVLEQVLQWEHLTDPDFEPLRIVHAQARCCHHELARSPLSDEQRATMTALANGVHPWCDLRQLQQSGEDIDDDAWAQLHDRVVEQFGRPLATAFSRGRIGPISFTPVTSAIDPCPPEAGPIKTAAPESAPALSVQLAEEFEPVASDIEVPAMNEADQPDFVYDFESTGSRMTGVLETAPERIVAATLTSPIDDLLLGSDPVPADDDKPDSGLLETWAKLRERISRSKETSPHETPAAALAHAALGAAGEERVRCLFRLIDQLLIDDRLDLAYHLLRVLEGRAEERPTPLPASLIRAALLSRNVCYPLGELNRRVEDDLKQQQPRRHEQFPTEDRLAHEFLCRAAALTPALLCASSAAVRLLKAFPIEPGLIPLYNYCSRIASYAEKLQGKTAEMLQAGDAAGSLSHEMTALKEAARDWLTQTVKRTVPYVRSSPLFLHAHWTVLAGGVQRSAETAQLWSRWHETWMIVHRLLRPVIHGGGNDRTWVQHELERLTPLLRDPSFFQGLAVSADSQAAIAAMRDVLVQAIEFANGWLRLGGGNKSAQATLPLQELDELRVEVRERTDAVLAALRPYASIQKSPTLRAAAFCLQRVVQQIHALFESRLALGWREPDLRHLLQAELLKIPCLPLSDQWEPQVPCDQLETELLELISRGPGTWREAFDVHCRQRNHVATGRLLELPVWQGAAELSELTRLRQEGISECRRELQAEFDAITAEFRALSEQGLLGLSDQKAMQRQFDRLQTGLGKSPDFQVAEIQLQQLRLTMQRRSGGVASTAASVEHGDRFEASTSSQEDSTSLVEPESASSWVMDIFWEDK